MDFRELNKLLGNIDIYLLDQILKGRFTPEMKILDAGCGEGRNTHYFIQEGFQIFGVDQDKLSIEMARRYASSIRKDFDIHCFQVNGLENLMFHTAAFDAVLSSAVLHFARDENHFFVMVGEMIRVLRPGGIFWLRMCTDAGNILDEAISMGNSRFLLPDGSERFVLTEALLRSMIEKYGLRHMEPPKSVVVHGLRSMGVFVFEKGKATL
ncbi:MAG TPA: methyltransferase domain-containing protein [Lunatimonas sp.]|nr:methyltransferase domain-containing protein [Lunatimonas sp.]